MADMTLAEAIAEVKPHSNWNGAHFLPTLFRAEIRDAIATILNAVLSGDLITRADAELAVAEAIRRAADMIEGNVRHAKELGREIWAMPDIRALAPAAALAEVQRLRRERDAALARVEKLRGALKVTSAVLMAEQNRRGGKPFSGQWSIPAVGFSGTVDDALNQANAALDEDARHA